MSQFRPGSWSGINVELRNSMHLCCALVHRKRSHQIPGVKALLLTFLQHRSRSSQASCHSASPVRGVSVTQHQIPSLRVCERFVHSHVLGAQFFCVLSEQTRINRSYSAKTLKKIPMAHPSPRSPAVGIWSRLRLPSGC